MFDNTLPGPQKVGQSGATPPYCGGIREPLTNRLEAGLFIEPGGLPAYPHTGQPFQRLGTQAGQMGRIGEPQWTRRRGRTAPGTHGVITFGVCPALSKARMTPSSSPGLTSTTRSESCATSSGA